MQFVTEQISGDDVKAITSLVEKHQRTGMVVVELGTYTGRSALAMLPVIQRAEGHLYCVDWFRGNTGVEAEIGPSYRSHDILKILRQNLMEAVGQGLDADRVTIMVGKTVGAALVFPDRSVDVLFVDADHRYSQVKADLAAWLPKMKTSGLVFGHDFEKHLEECDLEAAIEHCEEDYSGGCHYGVIRAVSEQFEKVHRDGRIWWTNVR